MKILVLGSKGSMGQRYCAILRHLKEEVIEADIGDVRWHEWKFDRAIVATPTDAHLGACSLLARMSRDFLCEKPVDKNAFHISILADDCKRWGADARMVSNWKYAINAALLRVGKVAVMGEMEIEYNYYNSGKDGFFWDCIQPIYMAGRFKYNRTSPVFDCKVNGNPVTLDDFSQSYLLMVSEWLHGDKERLWSLEDAWKANRKVEEAIHREPNPEVGEITFGRQA